MTETRKQEKKKWINQTISPHTNSIYAFNLLRIKGKNEGAVGVEDEEYLVAELSQVWGLLCEYRS